MGLVVSKVYSACVSVKQVMKICTCKHDRGNNYLILTYLLANFRNNSFNFLSLGTREVGQRDFIIDLLCEIVHIVITTVCQVGYTFAFFMVATMLVS